MNSSLHMALPRQQQIRSPAIGALSLAHLSELTEVSVADLIELAEYGVLIQPAAGSDQTFYPLANVPILQHAARLRHDLDLDAHAFALAVMLCARIEDLEAQLREMRGEACCSH